MRITFLALFMAMIFNTQAQESQKPLNVFAGNVDRYPKMESEFLESRNVDIWLPEGYNPERAEGYPVLYMHDGQNLFDGSLGYAGMTWGVDEVMTMLQRVGKIEPTIVVGVWNTPKRWQDYVPQKPFEALDGELIKKIKDVKVEGSQSDAYLKFLVKELKPFVDKRYNTRPERKSTYVMGSSMGGLISMYAICEYPEVFGAAGCVSTHWPGTVPFVSEQVPEKFLAYLQENVNPNEQGKIYFDYGTETLDAQYEPYQFKADKIMMDKGFVRGYNWITVKFPGHVHNENAWKERLHVPILFLMGK